MLTRQGRTSLFFNEMLKLTLSGVFTITTLIVLFPVNANAQNRLALNDLDTAALPAGIRYEGKIKSAVQWKDVSGDHVVIASETGPYQNKKFSHENEGTDAALFVFHFLIKKDSAVQTWKVYDFVADCPLDIEASFIKNTFQVTDLDHNGNAEVWMMYKLACRGDVSPSEMKIIMYHGNQKYAMRGQNKVQLGEDEFTGGEYKFDDAFANGSEDFLDFAKKMWEQNIMQQWEED